MKTALSKAARFLFGFALALIAFVVGASSGVMMAEASNLPDAGKTASGADATGGAEGIATETQGREDGDPEFYSKEIDGRIIKIRPMATPIDQISRYAYLTSYGLSETGAYHGGNCYQTFSEGALPSPDLCWYTQRDFNVGLELAAFHRALSGCVDYFYMSS